MLLKNTLQEIIDSQRENLIQRDLGIERDVYNVLPSLKSHALILSGVRRCGKSTLLFQLFQRKYSNALYLNFEDTRLYNFEIEDFNRLDEVIEENKYQVLLFDEIQNIDRWEQYIRQKLDQGFQIMITGSNASLLSKELGTKLTGRHISKELFPFSFRESCRFKGVEPSKVHLQNYMTIGGFPEYVETENDDILNQLFDDILSRDIAVRYGVRDIKNLQNLALFLVSNVGKRITGNALRKTFDIGATSTVMEYLSYLEFSWILQFVRKFSYSLRKQQMNPRKVYAIDTGLISTNSGSFTPDLGRKFENLVYLHLRRKFSDIYYFSENRECDFIITHRGKIEHAIQVCYELNQDNLNREIDGLMEALNMFDLDKGVIITLDQDDRIKKDGKVIDIVNWKYFLDS